MKSSVWDLCFAMSLEFIAEERAAHYTKLLQLYSWRNVLEFEKKDCHFSL